MNEPTNECDDDAAAVDDGHTYTKYTRKRKMVYNKWRQHNICFAARLYSLVRVCRDSARSSSRTFSLFSSFRFSSSPSSSYSSSSFFASFVILMFHFNFIHRSSHCAAWFLALEFLCTRVRCFFPFCALRTFPRLIFYTCSCTPCSIRSLSL